MTGQKKSKKYDSSAFYKIRCKLCRNEQMTFSKPSSTVSCLVCGNVLMIPTGGKGVIVGGIIEHVFAQNDSKIS